MRFSNKPIGFFAVLTVAGMLNVGCVSAKTAADIAQLSLDIACAIENAELDDPALKEACKLTDAAFDNVKPALASHRRALVKRDLTSLKRDVKKPDGGQ